MRITLNPNQELSEVEKVQNPALGAYLLWRYLIEYQKHQDKPSNMLLCFVILPICFHLPTLETAVGTRASSGLGKFCEKFSKQREELFAIHERALKLRTLTLNSLSIGIQTGLFSLDYDTGTLRANTIKPPKLVDHIKPQVKCAARLGAWFQRLEPSQVFNLLKVQM